MISPHQPKYSIFDGRDQEKNVCTNKEARTDEIKDILSLLFLYFYVVFVENSRIFLATVQLQAR